MPGRGLGRLVKRVCYPLIIKEIRKIPAVTQAFSHTNERSSDSQEQTCNVTGQHRMQKVDNIRALCEVYASKKTS